MDRLSRYEPYVDDSGFGMVEADELYPLVRILDHVHQVLSDSPDSSYSLQRWLPIYL